MQRTKPPFRADHVGSLLRAAPLKIVRERRERGEISPTALQEIEDAEIRKIIRKQEDVGLHAISDGEFRRAFWHFDFLQHLDGCEGFWMEASDRKLAGKDLRSATGIQGRRAAALDGACDRQDRIFNAPAC